MIKNIAKLIMLVVLVLSFTGLAEASTGSIIDTFADESLIASKSYLDITAGEVYLDAFSSSYENYTSGTNKYEHMHAGYWAAQTFTTTTTHKVNSITLPLKRETSSTGGTVYFYIQTTSGGQPSGTIISSGSYARSAISQSVSFITIPMSEVILSPDTVYSIVGRCTEYHYGVSWYGYETGAYVNGSWYRTINSGSSWSEESTKDHCFRIYGNAYYSSGNFVSANLLSGLDVSSVDSFDYNVSLLPVDSSVQVQFSPDNVNWYNTAGVLNGWESLSQGENSISLSSLGWSGDSFYYKTEFLSSSDAATAILDEIRLNYTEGVIPEPASILFLGMGIIGLAVFKYKN